MVGLLVMVCFALYAFVGGYCCRLLQVGSVVQHRCLNGGCIWVLWLYFRLDGLVVGDCGFVLKFFGVWFFFLFCWCF